MKRSQTLELRRSARAKLAGAVAVVLRLGVGRRILGKLHQLSATGGMVQLDEPLEEASSVMIVFETLPGL